MFYCGEHSSATYCVKSYCLMERGTGWLGLVPVEISEPFVQPRIVMTDHFEIALKDGVVCYIEPNHGCEKADISFSDVLPKKVWLMSWIGKMFF